MPFDYLPGPELPNLQARTLSSGRKYQTPAGKVYPSVTTITQQHSAKAIAEWRARIGEEEADRITTLAAAKGSALHDIAENYVRGHKDWAEDITPIGLDLFTPIKVALDKHVNNIRYVEAPLYSDYLRTAGRVDLIAEWDGILSVIDFKSARQRKPRDWCHGYFMQESAYAVMHEERTKKPIKQLVTIISPDDTFDVDIYVESRDDWIGEFINLRKQYAKVRGHTN